MKITMIISMTSLLIPLVLFIFFRKFLNEQKYQNYIRISFYFLTAIGITLAFLKDRPQVLYFLLTLPLFSYWIYRQILSLFRKKIGRDPIDTVMNEGSGLLWDMLFNIGYVILGILLPFISILLIITQ